MSPINITALDLASQLRTIDNFYRMFNIPARRTKQAGVYWRLADFNVGYVKGIENLNGIALATDGCLLVVRTGDGKLIDVHKDSWVVDKKNSHERGARTSTVNLSLNSAKNSKLLLMLEEFL